MVTVAGSVDRFRTATPVLMPFDCTRRTSKITFRAGLAGYTVNCGPAPRIRAYAEMRAFERSRAVPTLSVAELPSDAFTERDASGGIVIECSNAICRPGGFRLNSSPRDRH